MIFLILFAAVCSYLLGNLNGAIIASRVIADDDVRSHSHVRETRPCLKLHFHEGSVQP